LFKAATHADWAEEPPKDLRTDGIVILRNIPVHHCADAHALLIGFDTGFTFCYSGDTRPCGAMVRAVPFNVSLLLHEATFDDDERGRTESLHKKHSTVAEALTISREMGCKACLLTHFSQRYPKAPPSASLKDQDNASFAVDGMWIPLTNEKILNLSILSKLIHQMIYK
jgi:ribonuclease Z